MGAASSEQCGRPERFPRRSASSRRGPCRARHSDDLDVRPRGKRGPQAGSARSRRVLRAEGARGDDRRRHARGLPAGGDPGDGDRRPRWSRPRLRHEARRVGRSRRARPGPRDRRLLRSQEPARRAGDVRAARDPRHPRARYRTDELPLFYAARGGPPVSARVEDVSEAAAIAMARLGARAHDGGRTRPPARREPRRRRALIEEALALAEERGVRGQDVTPFVLDHLHRASGGRTLRANRELVAGNAALAGELAVALAALGRG